MKFCAVICEYNPFHNGHAYQFGEIRRLSGCDGILCLMSGNFTQRGEAAVADKYTRARHAIEGGADAVIELPAAFSVAPAELFARGAVHVLSHIPAVKELAFGCESGTREELVKMGALLAHESKDFKTALKDNLKEGVSYIRARNAALLSLNPDIDEALLSSPNNILGGEYCHALIAEKSDISPLPIPRRGGSYADETLRANFSSASALRLALSDFKKNRRLIKKNVPAAVFADCPMTAPEGFKIAAMCALAEHSAEQIAATPDCAEGLENRLKTLAGTNPAYDALVEKAVSKRYTRARIKRVLAQNFLGIRLSDVHAFLGAPLYCNVLAVGKGDGEKVLSSLGDSKFPLLVRHSDEALLKREALECRRLDKTADSLYAVLSGRGSETGTLFL